MSIVKQPVSTKTALTIAGLATLASANYCVSDTIDNTINDPLDVLIELTVTPGTVSSNKQALLFAQASLDGIDFESGPTSGTSVTDEPNLRYIGVIPLNVSASKKTRLFSLAAAYGGIVPPYCRLIVKNDSGATFTAGSINISEVTGTVV